MSNIKNDEQNTHFDLNDFNKEFVFKKKEQELNNEINAREKLDFLDEKANKHKPKLYDLSILNLAIGIKNTWFGILDDLLSDKISSKIFMRNNRLFYIGLTIILLCILLYIYNFFTEDITDMTQKQIIEKHIIHHRKNNVSESL